MVEVIPADDPRVALPRALKALAQHVLTYADVTAWDIADQPTDEQRKVRRHAILDHQRALLQLALRSSSGNVFVGEFEAIKSELAKHSFVAFVPDELSAVYDAFRKMEERNRRLAN